MPDTSPTIDTTASVATPAVVASPPSQPSQSSRSAIAEPTHTPPRVAPYDVEVFYDGDCPLCLREINLLKWMDRRERVRFTDIAADGFDADAYGKSMDLLMAEIHGRLPADPGSAEDARGEDPWIIGVEVFRHLYAAVGFGWAVPVTRLPGVRHALDAGYSFFAKRRLWMTGRCGAEDACRVGGSGVGDRG